MTAESHTSMSAALEAELVGQSLIQEVLETVRLSTRLSELVHHLRQNDYLDLSPRQGWDLE